MGAQLQTGRPNLYIVDMGNNAAPESEWSTGRIIGWPELLRSASKENPWQATCFRFPALLLRIARDSGSHRPGESGHANTSGQPSLLVSRRIGNTLL
jgi:hypothetical protein